jgi:hypothetical protein
MAVRNRESADFVGIGLTHNSQLNPDIIMGGCSVLVSSSGCDSFDMNIGIAADPAVDAAIDLSNSRIPQSAFMHRQMYDGIVVGFVVEDDAHNTVVAQRPGPIGSDDRDWTVPSLGQRRHRRPE